MVGHRKHADHKKTPMKVLLCVWRMWEVFVEKVDEEETLLVTLTVNKVNKIKT